MGERASSPRATWPRKSLTARLASALSSGTQSSMGSLCPRRTAGTSARMNGAGRTSFSRTCRGKATSICPSTSVGGLDAARRRAAHNSDRISPPRLSPSSSKLARTKWNRAGTPRGEVSSRAARTLPPSCSASTCSQPMAWSGRMGAGTAVPTRCRPAVDRLRGWDLPRTSARSRGSRCRAVRRDAGDADPTR